MSDGHNPRCERSPTPVNTCTCRVCGGRRHGVAAVRERLGIEDEQEPREAGEEVLA